MLPVLSMCPGLRGPASRVSWRAMGDSALLSVVLVNKLVSLADHLRAALLGAFAKKALRLSWMRRAARLTSTLVH